MRSIKTLISYSRWNLEIGKGGRLWHSWNRRGGFDQKYKGKEGIEISSLYCRPCGSNRSDCSHLLCQRRLTQTWVRTTFWYKYSWIWLGLNGTGFSLYYMIRIWGGCRRWVGRPWFHRSVGFWEAMEEWKPQKSVENREKEANMEFSISGYVWIIKELEMRLQVCDKTEYLLWPEFFFCIQF